MTVWDDLMNCVCQNAAQRPGVDEVLDSLERHTVCTGAQCFETEADAFGLTVAPNANAPSNQGMFFMFMMFMMTMAFILRMQRPSSSSSSKAGSSSGHANEPPPPPPTEG